MWACALFKGIAWFCACQLCWCACVGVCVLVGTLLALAYNEYRAHEVARRQINHAWGGKVLSEEELSRVGEAAVSQRIVEGLRERFGV